MSDGFVGFQGSEEALKHGVVSAVSLTARACNKAMRLDRFGERVAGVLCMNIEFSERCKAMGVCPSMSSVGDVYAMAESFFARLERELIDRRSFRSKAEARMALFIWIEGWSNSRRRYSRLGQQSPMNFEKKQQERIDRVTQAAA